MTNASELARHEVEQDELRLTQLKATFANLGNSKSTRENALRDIRAIERKLGIDVVGEVNHVEVVDQPKAERTLTLSELSDARRLLRSDTLLSLSDVGVIIFALRNSSDEQASRLLNQLGIYN